MPVFHAKSRPFLLVGLLLAASGDLGVIAGAQSTAPQVSPTTPPPTILRTGRREVLLNLVVLDRDNHPVHNLHDTDLLVTEDGKPQKIASFQEHISPSAQPLTPANAGSGQQPEPTGPGAPVTILLLDTLNTPVADQMFVRRQILAYLHSNQPIGPVAIYGLGSRLYPIQEPTRDRTVLATAVTRTSAQPSPIQDSTLAEAAEKNAYSRLASDGASPNGLSSTGADSLSAFLAESAANRLGSRVLMTLSALSILAKIYTPVPGRKNVIWFSGAFPLEILPNPSTVQDPQRSFEEQVRTTDTLLSAAQIAIYPIAAEGLATDAIYGADAVPIGTGNAQSAQAMLDSSRMAGALARNAAHGTMEEIAAQTGGTAFYNTNGLADAIGRVGSHGDNYYTVIYVSSRAKNVGTYRKIHIKLSDNSYRLSYRRGYVERPPAP